MPVRLPVFDVNLEIRSISSEYHGQLRLSRSKYGSVIRLPKFRDRKISAKFIKFGEIASRKSFPNLINIC